jgi:hypothetical protein
LISTKESGKDSNLDKPLQETPIINQRTPLTKVPIHILQSIDTQTRFTTKKNNYTFGLCRYKSKEKHVTTPTVVAFKNRFSQWTIFVQTDFLVLCPNLNEQEKYAALTHQSNTIIN